MPVHALVVAGVTACAQGTGDVGSVEGPPGAPLPGLSAVELERFAEGRALFDRPFTPEEGLGPLFNQARCSSCHDLPTIGGHGAEPVTKVSRFDPGTGCSLLEDEGGDVLQRSVVPTLRDAGVLPEQIPASATAVTDLSAPALYGMGLVEAVPDEDILVRADPADRDGDGISGRPGYDAAGTLARFGRKGTHATLEAFIETALRVEMGLTTPRHPHEELPNGEALPPDADPVPDPEMGHEDVELLASYVRFLAIPAPRLPEGRTARASVRQGEALFRNLGCGSCHTPTMTTGPHASAALDRRTFRVYSDLLLHDLGAELADICAPGVEPGEWRTAPLVGLALRSEYLHDGRAQRVEDAILLHGGEAAAAREAFQRLERTAKDRLLAFLATL